ncbi:hypothetical protein GCM10022419_031290 [Nonomuraea rosea]|uniref:Photosynthesis system II assembly factor Ycf48/Hcf136-like domain-containing protein n=1 Tax=Nonomuraea rosea TaxID=638574 RepID=A0ABP6WE06_9ACTN
MRPRLAAAVLAVAVLAGCSAVPATGREPGPSDGEFTSGPAGTARPEGRWRVVHRQKGLGHGAEFLDIAATGTAGAWAVGERTFGTDGHEALLVRWDGARWRRLTKELPQAARHVTLTKVDASDPGNVWVVAEDQEGGESGLLHFDGRRWSFTPDSETPSEVIALGGGQAWTFGDGWARHFDGRRWTRHAVPLVTRAAVALSPRDIWAVGEADPLPDDTYAQSEPAVAHFDGRAWRRLPLPAPPSPGSSEVFGSGLSAVLAPAPGEAWAVGGYETAEGTFRPLSYRWNGTAWRAVAIDGGRLTGIARDGDGVVWVASRRFVSGSEDAYGLLAGGGERWSRVTPSAPVTTMTALPGGKPLWAIGRNTITEYR